MRRTLLVVLVASSLPRDAATSSRKQQRSRSSGGGATGEGAEAAADGRRRAPSSSSSSSSSSQAVGFDEAEFRAMLRMAPALLGDDPSAAALDFATYDMDGDGVLSERDLEVCVYEVHEVVCV